MPHLFTMFFQANQPSQTLKTGLGIGLALAKILVVMHGGTISAQSDGEGKGAEFTICLPVAEPLCGGAKEPLKKLLIVDDNPDHLEFLSDLLELHGYSVIKARDASEALRLATEQMPHACVIDIGLPDMDGYELARQLRAFPEGREFLLIAVTGYGTKADQKAFEEAGFDHYFPKPPNIQKLIRVLR